MASAPAHLRPKIISMLPMRIFSPLFFCLPFFAATLQAGSIQAETGPVQECRQAHYADPASHIGCLEAALMTALAATQTSPVSANAPSAALGSEQVQQKQRSSGEMVEQSLLVSIRSARYNSQGLGVFKLDNGQVWRETEAMPQHLRLKPDQAYAAELERGKVGGYRMQVEGVRRMLKVERLE